MRIQLHFQFLNLNCCLYEEINVIVQIPGVCRSQVSPDIPGYFRQRWEFIVRMQIEHNGFLR
jgi:hypothetical protein